MFDANSDGKRQRGGGEIGGDGYPTHHMGIPNSRGPHVEDAVQKYHRSNFIAAGLGDCGTPITYESVRWPDEVHITVGSLDHPEDMPPQGHVFTEEQIPWFHIADELPRFAKTSSDEV